MVVTISPLKKSDVNLLKDKAIELFVETSYLEKDYYIVHLIRCLKDFSDKSDKGNLLYFTGGTALAKAHKKIHRFSEDCDYILLSPNSNRKLRSSLKREIESHLRDYGFNVILTESRNENQNITYLIEYDCVSAGREMMRPELKLEVIVKNSIWAPPCKKDVISFLSDSKKHKADVVNVDCLSIEEISIGKLSALTWRFLDRSKEPDPTLIRHLYDLSVLGDELSKSDFFKNACIQVVEDDLRTRFKDTMTFCEATSKLIALLEGDSKYKIMYENYVQNFLYSTRNEDKTSYEAALSKFTTLLNSFN